MRPSFSTTRPAGIEPCSRLLRQEGRARAFGGSLGDAIPRQADRQCQVLTRLIHEAWSCRPESQQEREVAELGRGNICHGPQSGNALKAIDFPRFWRVVVNKMG